LTLNYHFRHLNHATFIKGGILEIILNEKRVPGSLFAYKNRFEFYTDDDLNRPAVVVQHDDIKLLDFFEKLTDEGRVGASDKQKPGTKYKFELILRMPLKVKEVRTWCKENKQPHLIPYHYHFRSYLNYISCAFGHSYSLE